MRVSLRQPAMPPRAMPPLAGDAPAPLLAGSGPSVVLGGHQSVSGLAEPVKPSASSLFGPRGACLAGEDGPLFVADTGHHRLMVWHRVPNEDGAPADILIGQPDFAHEGRNAKSEPGPATLNVPTGIAAAGDVLAVADAWNHRVLLWHGFPQTSNQPADIVLGQSDFSSTLPNRGLDSPRADTLNWCYGVTIAERRLFVADTGNRRVLIWDRIPERHGAPADHVLGQRDFTCRDENGGLGIGPAGMRWPHAIAVAGAMVAVADAGNNRIMVWGRLPGMNGGPCDLVLGQADFVSQEHNRAAYYPDAAALNMPYGLAIQGARLIAADTANSRLLGYTLDRLAMGAPARYLAGQRDFTDKGDNRWAPATRDSLCWPYGVTACGRRVVVADSGNNRISLWEGS